LGHSPRYGPDIKVERRKLKMARQMAQMWNSPEGGKPYFATAGAARTTFRLILHR